jgi:hypothetical protein
MVSKLLTVGLIVCGLGFAVQSARADGCGSGIPATAWQGPQASSQPSMARTTPAPPAGQTAQSNNQTYRSFSAEPAPAPTYSYAPSTTYSYPTYGYYGNSYYGNGYYGGYGYSYGSNQRWDNANNHGINPNAYP